MYTYCVNFKKLIFVLTVKRST